MQKNKFDKLLTILLIVITIAGFLGHMFQYRSDLLKKFDAAYWTKRYNESQWVIPNSKNSIGDDGLYMYAGYRYMQGDDPTLLNAEYPPLGKYVIGFFEEVTGYMNFFSLFLGGVVLVLFYLFNRQVFRSNFWALLPVTIFSFEPIFTTQIRAAYLDTFYLSMLLVGFIFFLRKKYILSGLGVGLFMATKAPFLAVVVYIAMIVYLFLQKQFRVKIVLKIIISSLSVFLLSYTVTFLHGHGFIYFLKVQKYIIHFYSQGAKGVIGAVIPMLFTGNWYTWFSSMQRVAEWSIGWPIVTVGGVFALSLWFKKKDKYILFQLLWCGFYLVFLMITPIFARYLLLLIPFGYNLSIWSLSVVIKSKFS